MASGPRSARMPRQALGHGGQGFVPRHGHELGGAVHVAAHERLDQAVVGVHGVEPETTLVAQPALVQRIAVHAEQARDPVRRGLDGGPAPERAQRARGLDLVEVPGPGREPVGRGGERAHGTDLHGVAAEVRREDVVLEDVDLDGVAATEEVDLRFAGDLRREPDAAAALDATLAVEQHELGDGDGLGPVPLLLEEAAFPRPVGHDLVLQWALAALVAHGTVEGVVYEEELEHPVLGLLHLVRRRVDHHAVGDGHVAGRLQGGAARTGHLHEAHPAHADRLHARVVAEARDERPGLLGGGDEELPGRAGDLGAVEGEGDRGIGVGPGGDAVVRGHDGVSHTGNPRP